MDDKNQQQPADTREKCAYCGKPIDPSDFMQDRIISRTWKHSGFRSPLRPYHRSLGCYGKDQMGHEG